MPDSMALPLSHLIVRVADTDASIDFWVRKLGGELVTDEELAAPALDAMFGREGVRIRDTFIDFSGIRLHTIEPLDVKRVPASENDPQAAGLGGLSFVVDDIEASRARMIDCGLEPTPIYDFPDLDEPVRMFFLEDPDGIRLEMIEGR